MIAVSVDYRLRDQDGVGVPLECVKDAKSVVRYLRENAAQLKVAPNKIVCAGGSVGAQLAATTAMIQATEVNDAKDNLDISCIPNAVIAYNPWYKCQTELLPVSNIVKNSPPIITFAGGKDKAIPPQEMLDFHYQFKQQGNTSKL